MPMQSNGGPKDCVHLTKFPANDAVQFHRDAIIMQNPACESDSPLAGLVCVLAVDGVLLLAVHGHAGNGAPALLIGQQLKLQERIGRMAAKQ
jgi:hypothetical protein